MILPDNLKGLFEDFDFSLPTGLDDITADFVAVVVCIIAVIAIIISVCVLSKKKKQRIAESERKKAAEQITEPESTIIHSKFVPEEKNREIREKLTVAENDTVIPPAVGREVSYAADFEPKKSQPRKPRPAAESSVPKSKAAQPRRAEADKQVKRKDVVQVEDGFVIVNAAQKEKLEKAYAVALRKCAVNGTSDDLEKLLDAKRILNKSKIPQREFEGLLRLLFPKVN